MIQIITNFKNGHTGQLSAVTSFLLSLGAIARFQKERFGHFDVTIRLSWDRRVPCMHP